MNEEQFRGSLGERFEGFEASPSKGLWGAISESLDEDKKRRGAFWWWIGTGMAAAIVLGGVVSAGFFTTAEKGAEVRLFSHKNNALTERQINHTNNELPETTLATENETTINDVAPNTNSIASKKHAGSADITQINSGNKTSDTYLAQNHSTDTEATVADDDLTLLAMTDVTGLTLNPAFPGLPEIKTMPRVKQSGKWFIGGGGNTFLAQNIPTLEKIQSVNNDFVDSDTVSAVELASGGSSFGPDYRISRPVGLEFMVGYQASKRVAISSGVELSQLTFQKFVYNSYSGEAEADPYMTTTTTIGVPLRVHFNWASKKRWSIFSRAGFISEIPIREKTPNLDAAIPVSADVESTKFTKKWISGYRGAVELATGVAYQFTDRLSFEISPSIRWYGIQSIKTETLLVKDKMWAGGDVKIRWQLGK